jgi:solute carrier family 25 folate transporter 32
MWAGAKEILHREGWRGFYKGLGVSCLGVSHGAVQFAAYEPLKRAWMSYSANVGPSGPNAIEDSNLSRAKLGNDATLAISSASKMFAGTVTYPYQVIRARLQTYDSELRFGKGIVGVSKKIWKEEGTRGFYRGLGPNIVRVLPATWVTFLVYENVRYYLPQMEL